MSKGQKEVEENPCEPPEISIYKQQSSAPFNCYCNKGKRFWSIANTPSTTLTMTQEQPVATWLGYGMVGGGTDYPVPHLLPAFQNCSGNNLFSSDGQHIPINNWLFGLVEETAPSNFLLQRTCFCSSENQTELRIKTGKFLWSSLMFLKIQLCCFKKLHTLTRKRIALGVIVTSSVTNPILNTTIRGVT